MKITLLILTTFVFVTFSCKTIFNKQRIIIEGNISAMEHNAPLNSKLEFYFEKNLIYSIDSTFGGKYRFEVDKKWINENCYFIISDSKGIVEKTDWLPTGLLECSKRKDTIPIFLSSFKIKKDINIGECDFKVEDNTPHK